MKRSKYIPIIFISGYLIICSIYFYSDNFNSLPELDRDKNLYISEVLNNDHSLQLLSNSTNEYDENYIKTILTYPVIADTTLRNVVFENGNYYLKAVVHSSVGSNILLKLKVEDNLVAIVKRAEYMNGVVIADISEVHKLPFEKEITDMDGTVIWYSLVDDIIIEGELTNLLVFKS